MVSVTLPLGDRQLEISPPPFSLFASLARMSADVAFSDSRHGRGDHGRYPGSVRRPASPWGAAADGSSAPTLPGTSLSNPLRGQSPPGRTPLRLGTSHRPEGLARISL